MYMNYIGTSRPPLTASIAGGSGLGSGRLLGRALSYCGGGERRKR
jgi:hypothetical protein